MKAVAQRVSRAEVRVDGDVTGRIDHGLMVLFCAERDDDAAGATYFAEKISKIRIFADDAGKMNRSVLDVGGGVLAVSQFTLAGEWRKGNRPGFSRAADPETGRALYDHFCEALRETGLPVETGKFAAEMEVDFINDGPITIIMDSHSD